MVERQSTRNRFLDTTVNFLLNEQATGVQKQGFQLVVPELFFLL